MQITFRRLITRMVCRSLVVALAVGFGFSSTGYSQVGLNANPLDPFPSNVTVLTELGKKEPAIAAAIESFKTGNVEKLKKDLEDAKKANPNLPMPDLMVARMLMANGQWPDALAALENYIAANPSDAECFKNFAEIAMVGGRWTDAWLHLEKSYSLVDGMKFQDARKNNFLTELVKLRGEVAERRRDVPMATKLFETLSKLQPEKGDAFWALGRMKVSAGEVDAGAALLKKAKLLDKSLPQPDLAIASALVSSGSRDKAEAWYKSGLADKATSTSANWVEYTQFLIDEGREADAKVFLEKAPPEYQGLREFKLLKAIVARYMGDQETAEQILSELHRANPNDFDAADNLALVLVESNDEGKRARAQQISESNLRQAPNQERLAATAAWVKYKTGSADVADKILGQVVSGGRISPQTAYYAAMILKSLGRADESVQFMKSAVAAPGTFPQKKAAKAAMPTEVKTAP
jgi:tetratricopeptide (TPR) repeat protein